MVGVAGWALWKAYVKLLELGLHCLRLELADAELGFAGSLRRHGSHGDGLEFRSIEPGRNGGAVPRELAQDVLAHGVEFV